MKEPEEIGEGGCVWCGGPSPEDQCDCGGDPNALEDGWYPTTMAELYSTLP